MQNRLQARTVPPLSHQVNNTYHLSLKVSIITMITNIIAESKAVEKDALVGEDDAQVAYEGYVQDTSMEIDVVITPVDKMLAETKQKEMDDIKKKLQEKDEQIIKQKAELQRCPGTTAWP